MENSANSCSFEEEEMVVGFTETSPDIQEESFHGIREVPVSVQNSGTVFKEECIHLIAFNNDTQKFEVSQEARDMLSHVRGPLGVIAVAGMYRTGKSYLLNRMLLNRPTGSGGFGVGPSINPCTKGLWLWGTPVAGTTAEGTPVNVLVVDSEGIGGLDEDNNHDTRIFSLALLLSSYFLYNSVGSIDENALSSLSLVVNITKHIHLKSSTTTSGEISEEDISQLSEYLPSFMWVVRDFALQLVDEGGLDISQKDYLERALTEKGAQDDPKNEIRRALKQFFKDRQCQTMIRPLTNEEELQNLEKLPLSELRGEFVEQIQQLRKSVLHNMRPKAINGQLMNGAQWIQLVEIYVSAINEGAVPSIQSAWTYICQQGADKALEEAKQQFENEISLFVVHLPMNQDDLEAFLKDQVQALTEDLHLKVKGDPEVLQNCLIQLGQYITTRSQEVLNENRLACKRYATDLLGQLFNELTQQFNQQLLPNGMYDLSQLDAALQEVISIYESNALDFGPGGLEKVLLLADHKCGFLQDLLHHVGRHLSGEMSLMRNLDSQSKERLEQHLREAKEESRLERQRAEERLKQALMERSEAEAQAAVAKEQVDTIRQQREEETRDLREELHKLRDQVNQEGDHYRSTKEDLEERVQQLSREKLQVESDWSKERALFDQKVEYLERSLQEKSDRERNHLTELHTKRSELTSELKATIQRYESEVKVLQGELEEERDRVAEVQGALEQREQESEEMRERWLGQEATYKNMLGQAQDQIKHMEQTLQALKRESDGKASQAQAQERVDLLNQQLNEQQEQAKEASESAQTREHELLKDKALKEQKIQFLEVQLQDAKRQLEESHRQHEHMVKALKGADRHATSQSSDDSAEETLEERVSRLQQELYREREDHAFEQTESESQIEQLQERLSELDMQTRISENDHLAEIKSLQEQLQDLEGQRLLSNEKIKHLEAQRGTLHQDFESKYAEALLKFEADLDLQARTTGEELRQAQQRSESALQQLKEFYEREKDKLESRIQEERDRGQRRMAQSQEEIEAKWQEEAQDREEEIECLQRELNEAEQRHQAYVTQVDHELSLKHQMLEGLERQLREARDRTDNMENTRNTAFERQLEHFEQQRQEYNAKIDRLQGESLEKDRTLSQLQLKLERLGDDLERRKAEGEQSRVQNEKERKVMGEKLDSTKKKLTEAQDEGMRSKLDFGREQALAKQQIEFMNKKIEELQKQLDDSQRFYDEKIKHFRADCQEEAQAQIERITSEKELWENKYEQKRRALKEIEQSLSRSNTDLEKRVATLQTSLDRMESDKRSIEENYQDQVQSLQEQLQNLDSSAGAAFYYGSAAHAEDVMKLRSQVSELEREHSDLQCAYDRDKALWEGKCQFLEQQKETYKRDLLEQQKKFEITLEQMSKRGSIDKDKQETSQQALIRVIEGKYNAKIREMMDTHTQVVNEAQAKARRLEQDLKGLNDRMHLEQRGKQNEQGSMEKRVQDLLESERRLISEVDELKLERDRRMQDFHKQLDKEKETYRARLAEQESKAKESEKLRSQQMFEFEKERARWQLEKDGLACKVQELEEKVENLIIQKENLMKENTRMRCENKSSKRHGSTASYHQSSVAGSTVFPTQQSIAGSLQQYHQSHLLNPQVSQSTLHSTTSQSSIQHNFHPQQQSSSATRYGNMMQSSASKHQLSGGAVGANIQQAKLMKENSRPISSSGLMNSSMIFEDGMAAGNMTAPLAMTKNYARYSNTSGMNSSYQQQQ